MLILYLLLTSPLPVPPSIVFLAPVPNKATFFSFKGSTPSFLSKTIPSTADSLARKLFSFSLSEISEWFVAFTCKLIFNLNPSFLCTFCLKMLFLFNSFLLLVVIKKIFLFYRLGPLQFVDIFCLNHTCEVVNKLL